MSKINQGLRIFVCTGFSLMLFSCQSGSKSQVNYPQSDDADDSNPSEIKYPIKDVYEKLVDNVGEGYERLYGTRNFRLLMHGVLYRGGANNISQRDPDQRRGNMNPLPLNGLENLCAEGFSTAVYLYSENYDQAPKTMICTTRDGKQNHVLSYLQMSPLDPIGARKILELVRERIVDESTGPIYLHCWNGWHASGLASTLVLRQFCGYNVEEAINYWNQNTDGNNGPNYEGIRNRIRNFQPYEDLKISDDIKRRICPEI